MSWDAIAAMAEAIGAVAVVASLLYLALQVRASARASAVQSKLESTRLLNDFVDFLIESPELADLFQRGLADYERLDKPEQLRFSNMSLKAFWFFSAGHFQFPVGALDEDEFHEVRTVMRYWIRRPGTRVWWEKLGRISVSPVFARFVDEEMQRIRVQP